MKVLFVLYGFAPHSIGGACVYHYELAKLLTANGCSVVVCSRNAMEPYNIDGIEVHPLTQFRGFAKLADVVITVPSMSGIIDHKNIVAIQHTVQAVKYPHPHAKIIYCAEHIRGMYPGYKSMVWRPMMRLTPAKKPRKLKRTPVIGFINNARTKGGHLIEPMANEFPDYRFEVIEYPGSPSEFARPVMPNIRYTMWQIEDLAAMDRWYDGVDLMVLGSISEGYSTVALECLAKGIPCVASAIPGYREPLGEMWYPLDRVEQVLDVYPSQGMLKRWEVVRGLNRVEELLKFIA